MRLKAVEAELESLGLIIQRGEEEKEGKEEKRTEGKKEGNFSLYSGLTKSVVTVVDYSSPEVRVTFQLPAGALIDWLTQSPFPSFFSHLV